MGCKGDVAGSEESVGSLLVGCVPSTVDEGEHHAEKAQNLAVLEDMVQLAQGSGSRWSLIPALGEENRRLKLIGGIRGHEFLHHFKFGAGVVRGHLMGFQLNHEHLPGKSVISVDQMTRVRQTLAPMESTKDTNVADFGLRGFGILKSDRNGVMVSIVAGISSRESKSTQTAIKQFISKIKTFGARLHSFELLVRATVLRNEAPWWGNFSTWCLCFDSGGFRRWRWHGKNCEVREE